MQYFFPELGSYVVFLRGVLRLFESDVDVGERVADSVSASKFGGGGRSARCAGVAGVAGQRGMVYGFERAVAGPDVVGLERVCVASFPRWERRIVAVGVCWGTLGGDGVTHLI
jgi:hypothetical protein